MLPLSDQGACCIYRLHSSLSIASLLPFETSYYCNRMALSNKKPLFPSAPDKYLAIVLEENNKKNLSGLRIAQSMFFHLYKDVCSQAHSMQM